MNPEVLFASLKVTNPVGVAEDAKLVFVGSLKRYVWLAGDKELRGSLKVPKRVLDLAPAFRRGV
eukprot:8254805-Alexandrium_andersonii.AAC.1